MSDDKLDFDISALRRRLEDVETLLHRAFSGVSTTKRLSKSSRSNFLEWNGLHLCIDGVPFKSWDDLGCVEASEAMEALVEKCAKRSGEARKRVRNAHSKLNDVLERLEKIAPDPRNAFE